MLKVTYTKLPPKQYIYRDYKFFDKEKFLAALKSKLVTDICDYGTFEKIFVTILDKFAPLKTKFLRANNKPHISKKLRKAMMTRTRLRNIAFKTKLPADMANYRKQRNLVINLNKRARKSFFQQRQSIQEE